MGIDIMDITEARNKLRAWLADSDQRQDETGYSHITGLFWRASEDKRSEITKAFVTLMTRGRTADFFDLLRTKPAPLLHDLVRYIPSPHCDTMRARLHLR